MKAEDLLAKIIKDNNLKIELTEPVVRLLKDGAFLIEKPVLLVSYENDIPPAKAVATEEATK